jgi:hypothetical protein
MEFPTLPDRATGAVRCSGPVPGHSLMTGGMMFNNPVAHGHRCENRTDPSPQGINHHPVPAAYAARCGELPGQGWMGLAGLRWGRGFIDRLMGGWIGF